MYATELRGRLTGIKCLSDAGRMVKKLKNLDLSPQRQSQILHAWPISVEPMYPYSGELWEKDVATSGSQSQP